MPDAQPVQILLVEDSSDDVLLTRKALQGARIANDMQVASDGEEAMRRLRAPNGAANPGRTSSCSTSTSRA